MTPFEEQGASLTRLRNHSIILVALLLTLAAAPVDADPPDCETEAASVWAPAGYICPPRYGVGTASTWNGPGAATNSCTHAIRDTTGCPAIAIRSLDTGLLVVTEPIEWCMCWVGVIGPYGETERLVDLGPGLVEALGLPGPGLYAVEVTPFRGAASSITLPDTAVAVRP